MSWTSLYRLFTSDGALLYVGISSKPMERWNQHRVEKPWWTDAASVTVQHFASRGEALSAETAAIKSEKPHHNLKGSVLPKSQPTSGAWTRLLVLEPALQRLFDAAMADPSADPDEAWYATYKPQLSELIGWGRGAGPLFAWHLDGQEVSRDQLCKYESDHGREELWSCEAYDVAYDTLYETLAGRSAEVA